MILDTIVARKREEVAALRATGVAVPDAILSLGEIDEPRGFRAALVADEGVSIIAEAKKASPSKGLIEPDFHVEKIVTNYEKNGARAISVLTDRDFFQGSLEYMVRARKTVRLPVIRKDFMIDELQIEEASLYGADAILLIAAILDKVQIRDYFALAKEKGMDVLTEVHNEAELETVLNCDCDLIGINNRNLNDFTVDIETTFRLRRLIPPEIPVVSESGLGTPDDVVRLRENGVNAALIGESLMRAGTESAFLQALRKG